MPKTRKTTKTHKIKTKPKRRKQSEVYTNYSLRMQFFFQY